MASRPLQFERRELTGLTWFVLVAGITASILGSLAWRDYARDETHAELGRSSTELSKRLTQDVRRHDQALLSTAGLFAASNSVEESGVLRLRHRGEAARALPRDQERGVAAR